MGGPISPGNVPSFHFPAWFHELRSLACPEARVLKKTWAGQACGFSTGRRWAAPLPVQSSQAHQGLTTDSAEKTHPTGRCVGIGTNLPLFPAQIWFIRTKSSFLNEWGKTAQRNKTYRESTTLAYTLAGKCPSLPNLLLKVLFFFSSPKVLKKSQMV